MTSHRSLGGLEISIGKGGLRFKKKPSAFNICVGKALKGTAGPVNGGRYDRGFQAKFTDAVRDCSKPKVAEPTAPRKRRILEEPLLG